MNLLTKETQKSRLH